MECSAYRQVLADATRQNAEVIRALGMTGRFTARWTKANELFLQESIRATDVHANLGAAAKVLRYTLQSALLGIGAYLVVIEQASGGIMIASVGRDGTGARPDRGGARDMEATRARHGKDSKDCVAYSRRPQRRRLPPLPCRGLAADCWCAILPSRPPAPKEPWSRMRRFPSRLAAALLCSAPAASGKSSLVKALVGIWPMTAGVLRLDEAALDQWHPDDLGRHIGYLPQDVALFDGTVAENIARFDEGPRRPKPSWRLPGLRARMSSSYACRTATPPGSVKAACRFPPASASVSAWPARCSEIPS